MTGEPGRKYTQNADSDPIGPFSNLTQLVHFRNRPNWAMFESFQIDSSIKKLVTIKLTFDTLKFCDHECGVICESGLGIFTTSTERKQCPGNLEICKKTFDHSCYTKYI